VIRGLGKKYQIRIPGATSRINAQALIVPDLVTRGALKRDALIVCTMSNMVYCFDLSDGTQIWSRQVATPVSVPRAGGEGFRDFMGILGTPAIDATTQVMYCVAWSSLNGSTAQATYSVYSLRLSDGSDAAEPCPLGSLTNSGVAGSETQKLSTHTPCQQSALLLTRTEGVRTIFFGAAGVSDDGREAGWIVAYDAARNAVSAVISLAPGSSGARVEMSGQGLVADEDGFLYCCSGHGGFDGQSNFGESFLKLSYSRDGQSAALRIVDWWSPFTDSARFRAGSTAGMETADVGSSGVGLIPELGIAFGCGRDGILYVLNAQNMGKTKLVDLDKAGTNYSKLKQRPVWFTYDPVSISPAPDHPADLNFLWGLRTHGMQSSCAVMRLKPGQYRAFCWGENSALRAWSVTGSGFSHLGFGAEVASANALGPPGGTPGGLLCLSSNGSNDAILWATAPIGNTEGTPSDGYLYAYDASNIAATGAAAGKIRLLYKSPPFPFNPLSPPIVSGGNVIVPNYVGGVDVYGI
jgi:hypothetical protein